MISKILAAIKAHPKGKPLTESGAEVPDPVPMAPPIGYKKQPTMVDHIRAMVRSENLRREVEAAGYETMDEADDFDVDDDFDPTSPYEHNFDPVAPVQAAPTGANPSPPGVASPPAAPVEPAAPPLVPDPKSVHTP